ncbi:protein DETOXIFICATION 41-like isoform X1 [Neltuma alba]|uniref:protein DETOXIFICATION 41-like isoform X1 n=1 Tax=Neltuma alba TaxID=207710 RepID=UPI0010A47067|nr:protein DETOXIFICATION 41-like isoform X1 [Prosopis alba]
MASAVQTLCGQAYGANKHAVMGIICQRSMIMQLLAAVVLTFFFWYSGPILKFLGKNDSDEIAEIGQTFGREIIPMLYAYALVYPMQRFLIAQNIVNFLAYVAFGVFCFHLLFTWLVVSVLGFGLLGAALTLCLSWWLLAFIIGLYIIRSPSCRKSWTGFSLKAFKLKGLWTYLKLVVSSAAMMWVCSCSVCFIRDASELYHCSGLSFHLHKCSVRVGNELGAGNARVAKLSVAVCNGIGFLICFILAAIVLAFRVALVKLYSADSQVIRVTSSLFPLIALYFLINGNHFVLFGQAIGSGRQAIVGWMNLVIYAISFALAYFLGFKTSLGLAVEKAAARLQNSADEKILNDLIGD